MLLGICLVVIYSSIFYTALEHNYISLGIICLLSGIIKELLYIRNYGGVASKKHHIPYTNYRLNTPSNDIIVASYQPYIAIPCIGRQSWLWKYYIDGVGVIFRWDERHSEIEKLFAELKEKS